MAKLISKIQNYPLSKGAVAMNNSLLLDQSYALQTNELQDYFSFLLEISKNINFFDDLGINSKSWFDLLKQGSIFRFAQFLTIHTDELNHFFSELEQTNHFNSDSYLSQKELETVAYQRIQIIQYLFSFYKSVAQTIDDRNKEAILSILKNNTSTQVFVQFEQLIKEYFTLFRSKINKVSVRDFNKIQFEPANRASISTLKPFFNPSNLVEKPLLKLYATRYEKIKVTNKYLSVLFKSLMQIHTTFSRWAVTKLADLVDTESGHTPHNALLIAFCKLKMLFDQRYNQLIEQNTRFVFEDILQLERQTVVPDTAYVSIDLAKNIKEHFIEKDSLFKAGKNNENKSLFYKATQELVLNNAKIEKIKSTVRVFENNQLKSVFGAEDAANPQWQVNNAWLPFNDVAEAWTGIGFESKLISLVSKKGTEIGFEFAFVNPIRQADDFKGNDFIEKFEIKLVFEDDTEERLNITSIENEGNSIRIWAVVANDLTKAVKTGINARIRLISPNREKPDNDFVNLCEYLLSEQVEKVKVRLEKHQFEPGSVKTATATSSSSESFIAFGVQSLAGSSFSITHPFLKYAQDVDLTINWAEKIESKFDVMINEEKTTIMANAQDRTEFKAIKNKGNTSISVELRTNLTKEAVTKQGSSTPLLIPITLRVKSIEIAAELSENIYGEENEKPRYEEELFPAAFLMKSLRVPFIQKQRQKVALRKRFMEHNRRITRQHYNNSIAHLYPLGSLIVYPTTKLTFLPDYSKNELRNFVGELCIGLADIAPGQSISLLFNIAEETAEQSKLEAKISWYYLSDNSYAKIDESKIVDTTENFLQSGLVQLSLPAEATNNNTVIEGDNLYWLIARCDQNYELVANIKEIKTNGLMVVRVIDENNQEAKISTAPGTIENVYPKTAKVKEVHQDIPSIGGRDREVDSHFFWRSSQRLRHKQRAINQWDFEQLTIAQFSAIYKVKCLNHACYSDTSMKVYAKAGHTLLVLLPHYRLNMKSINFQPAITMAKLIEIKNYLETKTGPFNRLQVVNTNWDVIRIEVEVMLNPDYIDIPYYQNKLEEDLKKLIAPWAFEQDSTILEVPKLYMANIVNYIDELAYVHHIKGLKLYKNDLEQFDEIIPTSEIHLLTSAFEHTVKVVKYEY